MASSINLRSARAHDDRTFGRAIAHTHTHFTPNLEAFCACGARGQRKTPDISFAFSWKLYCSLPTEWFTLRPMWTTPSTFVGMLLRIRSQQQQTRSVAELRERTYTEHNGNCNWYASPSIWVSVLHLSVSLLLHFAKRRRLIKIR